MGICKWLAVIGVMVVVCSHLSIGFGEGLILAISLIILA